MSDKKILPAYIAMIFYCLITAISMLTIHHANQKANPTVVTLYTFLICTIFFNIVNFNNIKQTHLVAVRHFKELFILNLTTAIIWLATFWGLRFLTPALFITICLGSTPVASYLISLWKNKKFKWAECTIAVFITLLIALIVFEYRHLFPAREFYATGITLSIIAGMVISVYLFYSKYMHTKLTLSPVQILALRFYLLIIIGIGLSISYFDFSVFTRGINVYSIVFIALVSSILPLYLMQYSIHKLGALKSAYLIPLTPVLTYVLELIYGLPFKPSLLILILLLSIVLSFSVKIKTT